MRKLLVGLVLCVPFISSAAIVHPPVDCSLTANVATVTRGEAVTVSWTTTNAVKATLNTGTEAGSFAVGPIGSMVVHPRGSKPYLLSVSAPVGQFKQCSVWITVNDPVRGG